MELIVALVVATGMIAVAGLPFAMAWVEEALMTSNAGSRPSETGDVRQP